MARASSARARLRWTELLRVMPDRLHVLCRGSACVMRRLSRRSPSLTYCSRSYGARQTCTVVSLLPDTMWLPLGNQATLAQASGAGTTPFAIRVPYASSFQGGTQEATIVLYSYTGNHVIAGAVMVKVLLSTS